MKIATRAGAAALVLLCLHFPPSSHARQDTEEPAPAPPPAEEPTPEPAPVPAPTRTHAWGALEIEAGVWMASPSGTEFTPTAYRDSDNPNQLNTVDIPSSDEAVNYFRVGIALPHDIGMLSGNYASFSQDEQLIRSEPGNFTYAELQVTPFGAGVFEDGFSDGLNSTSRLQVRDWRINFRRLAADTPHFRATWHAGLRGVFVRREMTSTYYALNPPPDLLPPLIPGSVPTPPTVRPDLVPNPDQAYTQSAYDGTGVDAGIDFRFPFGKTGAFSIEAGFSMAVLFGKLTTQYNSTTSSYVIVRDEVVTEYLTAPYDEFLAEDPENPGQRLLSVIQQHPMSVAFVDDTSDSGATALDAYIGVRLRVWRSLSLFGGFRDVRYPDTAAQSRIENISSVPGGTFNFASQDDSKISPTFEGLYFGLGFTY